MYIIIKIAIKLGILGKERKIKINVLTAL